MKFRFLESDFWNPMRTWPILALFFLCVVANDSPSAAMDVNVYAQAGFLESLSTLNSFLTFMLHSVVPKLPPVLDELQFSPETKADLRVLLQETSNMARQFHISNSTREELHELLQDTQDMVRQMTKSLRTMTPYGSETYKGFFNLLYGFFTLGCILLVMLIVGAITECVKRVRVQKAPVPGGERLIPREEPSFPA